MKRLTAAALVAVLVALTACQAPAVRTTSYRRVLIIGDSFINGGSFLEYPSLATALGPELASVGTEVRVLGAAAEQPGPDHWVSVIHQEVVDWDPDLVIIESVIPDGSSGSGRLGLVATWSFMMVAAAAKGADVWRIVPPHPVPGSFIDLLYSPHRVDLLSAQSDGLRVGATNRVAGAVDLDATLAGCPGAWTWDGGHLTSAGQACVAADLYGLIAHHPLPVPTTVPPTTAPPVTISPSTTSTTTSTTSTTSTTAPDPTTTTTSDPATTTTTTG